MDYTYYDQYINKKTKARYDVTPIFQEPKVFQSLVFDLLVFFKNTNFNLIAGIDALGFIIGSAMAYKKKLGFVSIRKGGKLPGMKGTVLRCSFTDYTKRKKTLEINKSAIKKGDRVLIADEWIETGAQMNTAIKLIEKLGGKVSGIAVLCAEKTPKTKILFEKYNLKAVRVVEKS